MTDGIDFGQNSQAKFSLNSLMTPQIAGSNIAQDFAQATTVVGNIGNYLKQEGDTANQARYFNANIEYQNLQAEQTKELNDVGNDLSQRRQVLDKYNSLYTGLADKYELNDKYRASLGSQTTSHIDTLENQYGALYTAQKQSEAIDNTTYVISNAINTNPEETKLVYAEMKDYLKANTNLSDREIGDVLAGSYINAKVSAMSDKADMTLEEAKQNKKDIQDVLEGADPRIVGSALYKQGIQGFNSVIEQQRSARESLLVKRIELADMPIAEINKYIKAEQKAGVVKNDEYSLLYQDMAKNSWINKRAAEANRDYTTSNRELSLYSENLKFNGVKDAEEYKTKILAYAEEIGADKRIAEHLFNTFNKSYQTEITKQASRNAQQVLNILKTDKSQYTDPQKLAGVIEQAHSSTGVIPTEDLNFERQNAFGFKYKDSSTLPTFQDAVSNNLLQVLDDTMYKEVATAKVNGFAVEAMSSRTPEAFKRLDNIISSTNQLGQLPSMVGKAFSSVDVKDPNTLRSLEDAISLTSNILRNHPDKAFELLGHNQKEFFLYRAAMTPDKDGNVGITMPEYLKIKEITSGTTQDFRSVSQKSSDNDVYNNNYKNMTDAKLASIDRQTYDALVSSGLMGNREAIKMINEKNGVQQGSNYSLMGISTTDPNRDALVDAVKEYSKDLPEIGGKSSFISVRDNMLMVGTKDNPFMYSSGIPLKTVYTDDTKKEIKRDENGRPMLGIADMLAFSKARAEELRMKGIMEAPIYKKGLQQAYYKAVDNLGQYLDVLEVSTYNNAKRNFTNAVDAFSWLKENMNVDDTTLKAKLGELKQGK